MILRSLAVDPAELARATGWHLRPEGLCREEVCVPFAAAEGTFLGGCIFSGRVAGRAAAAS